MLISEHWKLSWHRKSLCCDCNIVFIIKTLTIYKGGRPQNYQAHASTFPSTYFTDAATKISSVNWWKALKSYGFPSDFVALAIKLLSCSALYVSIERIVFKFWKYSYQSLQLSVYSTAFKLVFCYRMLRGMVELEYYVDVMSNCFPLSSYVTIYISFMYQYLIIKSFFTV